MTAPCFWMIFRMMSFSLPIENLLTDGSNCVLSNPRNQHCLGSPGNRNAGVQHSRVPLPGGKEVIPGQKAARPGVHFDAELFKPRAAARSGRVQEEEHGLRALSGRLMPPIACVEVKIEPARAPVEARLPLLES